MDGPTWRPAARPPLVIVSGAPATGKSTLARLLADRLPLPLLAKDRLREIFRDAFDADTRAKNNVLIGPVFAVYYDLIAELLRAGVGVVAECNFFRGIAEPELAPVVALATPVIIHCQTSHALSARRFIERHELGLPERRYAFDGERIPGLLAGEALEPWTRAEPVEIGAPVLRVDTTDGYRPGLDAIVGFIRSGGAGPA